MGAGVQTFSLLLLVSTIRTVRSASDYQLLPVNGWHVAVSTNDEKSKGPGVGTACTALLGSGWEEFIPQSNDEIRLLVDQLDNYGIDSQIWMNPQIAEPDPHFGFFRVYILADGQELASDVKFAFADSSTGFYVDSTSEDCLMLMKFVGSRISITGKHMAASAVCGSGYNFMCRGKRLPTTTVANELRTANVVDIRRSMSMSSPATPELTTTNRGIATSSDGPSSSIQPSTSAQATGITSSSSSSSSLSNIMTSEESTTSNTDVTATRRVTTSDYPRLTSETPTTTPLSSSADVTVSVTATLDVTSVQHPLFTSEGSTSTIHTDVTSRSHQTTTRILLELSTEVTSSHYRNITSSSHDVTLTETTSISIATSQSTPTITTPYHYNTQSITTIPSDASTSQFTIAASESVSLSPTPASSQLALSPYDHSTNMVTPQPEVTTQPTPVASGSVPVRVCPCACPNQTKLFNTTIGSEQEEEIKQQIRDTLSIDKESLSSETRKKESADDSRTSSRIAGALGIFFLTILFGSIFVIDFVSAAKALYYKWFTGRM